MIYEFTNIISFFLLVFFVKKSTEFAISEFIKIKANLYFFILK